MYSSKSIHFAELICNFGYKLKCSPFNLVKYGQSIRLQKDSHTELVLRKLVCACFLLPQSGHIALGMYHELFNNPQQSERAQFYVVAAFMFTGMAFQIVTIIFFDQIFELVNAFLLFGEVLRT